MSNEIVRRETSVPWWHLRRRQLMSAFVAGALLGAATGYSTLGLATKTVVVVREPAVPAPAPVPVPVPVPAPAPAPEVEPRYAGHAFVIRVGAKSYVVLEEAQQTDLRVDGAFAQIPNGGSTYTATAAVKRDALAPDLSAWLGKKVIVDGHCHALVENFRFVARLDSEWMPTTPSERAENPDWESEALSSSAIVLAAELSGCRGRIAQLGDRPGMRVATAGNFIGGSATRAQALYADLPAVVRANSAYATAGLETTWLADATPIVRTFLLGDGSELVTVHGQAGACGEPEANILAVYRARGESLELIAVSELSETSMVEAVVDLEGDGSWELVANGTWGVDTVLLSADGTTLDKLSLPREGCPC